MWEALCFAAVSVYLLNRPKLSLLLATKCISSFSETKNVGFLCDAQCAALQVLGSWKEGEGAELLKSQGSHVIAFEFCFEFLKKCL